MSQLSGLLQNILVVVKVFLEDNLAEEVIWSSHIPTMCAWQQAKKGLGIYTTETSDQSREDNILLPQQKGPA